MLSARWRPQPASGSEAMREGDLALPEWDIVAAGRAHVLIEGSEAAIQQALYHLVARLPRPVSWWYPGSPWPVTAQTVVINEIAALTAAEQRDLLERLSGDPSALQIVSTSSTSLYRAVCWGMFRSDLYYRLNIIRIEVA